MTSISAASESYGHHAHYVDMVRPEYIPAAKRFYLSLKGTGESFFLADQIQKLLAAFLEETISAKEHEAAALQRLFRGCQEIILFQDYTYALLRPKIGVKRIVRLHPQEERFQEVDRLTYLKVKDAYVQGVETANCKGLELNFAPYFRDFPKITEPSDMGKGISFLNRHLAGQMYQNPTAFPQALLEFLQDLNLDGYNLLITDHIRNPRMLSERIDEARALLGEHDPDTPYGEVAHDLLVLGFDAGWGRAVRDVTDNLTMLARVMESADPDRIEQLIGRLPLVKTVLMVSPHGYFAQEGVLGKPDTGGQVTYVLDQARALEREMKSHFAECGLEIRPHIVILTRLIPNAEGTACNLPREKVHATEDCWIVRVPFRDQHGSVIADWISRFHIWPWLERFAEDSRAAVLQEFLGTPNLIVGHYSDGNLVAHRLADDLGTTHCACVHALEKTKYLFSDMRWADMESEYHFSCQFTADILSYNAADFIISSSYREIGGTNTEMGMFESYETFSMPGLYRVVSGMDPQLARYNIVPPGASEDYFFPNFRNEDRLSSVTEALEESLFSSEPPQDAVGHLDNPDLPPIFAMSRIDKVKNLPGLVELYGKSETLREKANLIIMSSLTDASQSKDQEEIEQIHRMYELIDHYNLHGHLRWRGARLDKMETGEVYRIMADRKGVFAQPAFMETFGLTVIEAMYCGLPVVVTCFGGPAEIVVNGQSGEVKDPNDHEAYAAALEKIVTNQKVWQGYHENGLTRVKEAFNWQTHARRILRLANVYSYWNYLDVMNRSALDQYVHTLYHTVYRPRAQAMLEG